MAPLTAIVLAGIAYLVGAIPFGLLIARAHGVDIQRVGSGNIGATNVFRCVGKGWGILTFAADAFKGFFSAWILPSIARAVMPATPLDANLALLCAAMAVVGHNWPVYLRFRGGKGVAVTVGALLGLAPMATLVGFLVWSTALLVSRYVSVASLSAAAGVSLYIWLTRAPGDWLFPSVMTGLAILIFWRHKSNIVHLANGTEHRFSFGKKKPPAS